MSLMTVSTQWWEKNGQVAKTLRLILVKSKGMNIVPMAVMLLTTSLTAELDI
jgi:hypothetical protein